MNYCECLNPNLTKNSSETPYCSVCGLLFDYQAWCKAFAPKIELPHPNITLHHEWTHEKPDPRRVQCEAVALKIYEQLDNINMEANYAGQVQQCEEAVTGEWCIRVEDIIQKELEWT